MPWKDTLIPRQKFCSLRRICAEQDRPLRGAEHLQTRPLKGAQQRQLPQRSRSRIVLFGMTKEILICIRRIIKCLLILALVLASLSVKRCHASWPEPLAMRPLNRAAASISVMSLQSLQLRPLNRPMTEAYRALRLQVQTPGTWISKAWIDSGDVDRSHPQGRPRPALQDVRCCSGPRTGSQSQGGQCLTLRAPQSLNSLCVHVPRPVRHSQFLEVRSQATTHTQPKACLNHPLLPSGRATQGAEQPARHRTLRGVRDARGSVCPPIANAPCHGCDQEASSAEALLPAGQCLAFSSMPPDRYPRSRYRPDGTRRRTQNEWLARKGKGKGGGNAKGKGNGGGRGGPGNGKGEPRDREDERPRNSQEHRDDRDRRDREEQDEGHRRRRDAHRDWEEPEEERGSTRRVPRTERRQDREEDRQRDRSRDRDRGTWTDWGQGWTWQNNRSWQNEDREDRRPSRRYEESDHPRGEWRQRTDNREETRPGRQDRRADDRPAREDRGRGDRSRPPTQNRRQERPADREEPRSDDRAAARRDPRPPTPPDSPRKRRQAARGSAEDDGPPALPRGPPQSRKQCQQQWERWSKISELLRHLRAGGAVEHLESFIHRGNMKNQHDRFHKPGSRTKDLPSFGNWNLSFFAFLLAGEVIGPRDLEGGYLWRGHRGVDLGSSRRRGR